MCFAEDRELRDEMIDLEDFEQAIEIAESFDQLLAAFRKFRV